MIATNRNRFISFSLWGELRESLTRTVAHLVPLAEQAYVWRQVDILDATSRLLLTLPGYEWLGQYYQALTTLQKETPHEAGALLEAVCERGTDTYRARSLISLGTLALRESGDLATAISMYRDAVRLGDRHDLKSAVQARKMIAAVAGMSGDHRGALALLMRVAPLVHQLAPHYPQVVPDFQNSFAVELAEVGRVQEAREWSRLAVSSPCATAWPAFRETYDELTLRTPSDRPKRYPRGAPVHSSNVVELSERRAHHVRTANRVRALQLIIRAVSTLDDGRLEALRLIVEDATDEQVEQFLRVSEASEDVSSLISDILEIETPKEIILLFSKMAEMKSDHTLMKILFRYFGIKPDTETNAKEEQQRRTERQIRR